MDPNQQQPNPTPQPAPQPGPHPAPGQPVHPEQATPQPSPADQPRVHAPASPNPAPAAPEPPAPAHPSPTTSTTSDFSSNPFLATGRGLGAVFSTNPLSSIAIVFAPLILFLLGGLGLFFALGFALLSPIISILFGLVGALIFILLLLRISVGTAFLSSEAHKGNSVTAKEAIFKGIKPYYGKVLFALFLAGLLIILGFIFFIIPGIILLARYSLIPYVIFHEDVRGIKALSRSWTLTKGHTMEMLGLLAATSVIGGDGSLLPIISSSALANRYHELIEHEKAGKSTGKVHWINTLVVVGSIVFFVLAIAASALSPGNSNSNDDLERLLDEEFERSFQIESDFDFEEFNSDFR